MNGDSVRNGAGQGQGGAAGPGGQWPCTGSTSAASAVAPRGNTCANNALKHCREQPTSGESGIPDLLMQIPKRETGVRVGPARHKNNPSPVKKNPSPETL